MLSQCICYTSETYQILSPVLFQQSLYFPLLIHRIFYLLVYIQARHKFHHKNILVTACTCVYAHVCMGACVCMMRAHTHVCCVLCVVCDLRSFCYEGFPRCTIHSPPCPVYCPPGGSGGHHLHHICVSVNTTRCMMYRGGTCTHNRSFCSLDHI